MTPQRRISGLFADHEVLLPVVERLEHSDLNLSFAGYRALVAQVVRVLCWKRYPERFAVHLRHRHAISSDEVLPRTLVPRYERVLSHAPVAQFVSPSPGVIDDAFRVLEWARTNGPVWREFGQIWRSCVPLGDSMPPLHRFDYPIVRALPEDIERIVALDHEVFAADDWVAVDKFAEWFAVDPSVFVVVRDRPDHVAGYYSLLFLEEPALSRFLDGRELREKDFRGADICRPHECRAQPRAYLFSVVLKGARPSLRRYLLQSLLLRVAHHYYEGSLREIYAVAASADGERLLRHAHFERYMSGELRADHNDLYRLELTDQSVRHGMEWVFRG